MTRFVLSPAAQKDVDEIWDYTAEKWGVDQAEKYTQDIRDACFGLAAGKLKSRTVDIKQGYLKYAVGSHIVYFRYSDTDLSIIRILHKSRDTRRHL